MRLKSDILYSRFLLKKNNILLNRLCKEGIYNNTEWEFSKGRKNKNEIIYDYRKFGKKLKKLNDGGLPHEHLVSGTSDEDAVIYLRTSREGHDIQEFFTGPGKENPLPMKSNMTVSKRGSYSDHLGNIILSVIENGNSELNVGEKIVLTIHQATTPGSSSRDAPLEIDIYLSG